MKGPFASGEIDAWLLLLADDAKRVELHRLNNNRTASHDAARDHPDIVTRLVKLALYWKPALPEKPGPACIGKAAAKGWARAAGPKAGNWHAKET